MKRRGGGDRLSSLPNEVVTRILSILPTKDAAVTTVFSDKIKPAFSVLTNIELDDSPISHCMYTPTLDERTPNFKKYVDYVLQHCQEAEKLDSFTLRFGRFHGDPQRYVFPNLIHLELGFSSQVCWDKVLVELLESCPSLETLVFPQGLNDEIIGEEAVSEQLKLERECWRTTHGIPLCCKSHLKRIVIKEIIGDDRELALVQFLLDKALVLESLVILVPAESDEDSQIDQVALLSALEAMPRASGSCSIKVLEISS